MRFTVRFLKSAMVFGVGQKQAFAVSCPSMFFASWNRWLCETRSLQCPTKGDPNGPRVIMASWTEFQTLTGVKIYIFGILNLSTISHFKIFNILCRSS